MTDDDYLQRMRKFSEDLRNDPVRLKAFMRSVMGPPKKTLEGKEKEQVLVLLAMTDPFEQSNNQHSWTDCYKIGETVYQVTSFPDDNDPIVDEMLKEEE